MSANTQQHTLTIGDQARQYLLYGPDAFRPAADPVPLLLMLHGAGGTARYAIQETGWLETAARHGLIVAFPEASRPDPARPPQFLKNPQTWNDGSGRFHSGERQIDDVAFLDAVIDDIACRHPIDPQRVYLVGISNGCSMALRFGVERGLRLAAIAGVAGYLSIPAPSLPRPIPLLYIIGTADPVTPLAGGPLVLPWGDMGTRPPVLHSVEQWAALLGCPPKPIPLPTDLARTSALRFGPGHAQSEVLFYTIAGMGHVWPGGRPILPERLVGAAAPDIAANELIWAFCARHPRRAATTS